MFKNMYVQLGLIIFSMVAMAGTASAALDSGIATELATIQTDGLALATLVWPVVITLFGSLVIFKLFKRFGNKI